MLNNKELKNIMVPLHEIKTVNVEDCFYDALSALNKNKWGAVFIVDASGRLNGIITDGDARRIFFNNQEPLAQLNSEPAKKYMNPHPTCFSADTTITVALKIMNEKMFLCAPVVDSENKLIGIVHLQHLVSQLLHQD